MLLRACARCRRHVDVVEQSCPFCGAALPPSARRHEPAGRLSRAAVFAGALAGCWTGSPKKQPDEQQHFAQPVDTKPQPGTIRGVVRGDAAAVGLMVLLYTPSGETKQTATNERGEFVFTGLAPGSYSVTFQPSNPRVQPSTAAVELAADRGAAITLDVLAPPIDRGPCCKPYGAPPARRRFV